MSTKSKSKKDKNKICNLIQKNDTEDEREYELSYYVDDRVKLMKEVLKIIKPKKIKNMAPDCIKDLDIEEINSMLLEELLGISNRRLKYIFIGQNLNEDSSSTDPEEEKHSVDVISLDDVSDDDFIDNDPEKSKRAKRQKKESSNKVIKMEKSEKVKQKSIGGPLQENLMSVLELLELQARARAIRSQLMLETNKHQTQQEKVDDDSDTDDAVIIEQPKNDEIVITSDSENEQNSISRNKEINFDENQKTEPNSNCQSLEQIKEDTQPENNGDTLIHKVKESANEEGLKGDTHDDDDIILIVDQDEIDGIMGE